MFTIQSGGAWEWGYTCLAPRPMTMVFVLGTRLHVHLRTKLENGILCNRQQPGSAVNSLIDEEREKNGTFAIYHILKFCVELSLRGLWATIWALLITKAPEEEAWVLINKLLAFCGEVIRLCIYCASTPSLHREFTESLIVHYIVLKAFHWMNVGV